MRPRILKWFYKIGFGIVDLFILTIALCYLYFQAMPTDDWALFSLDAFWLFIIVVVLYVIVVFAVSLLLTTMRQDSFLAKCGKTAVSTLLVIALFEWVLPVALWIFGYALAGDIKLTLMVAGVARALLKIWARRLIAPLEGGK